MNPELNQIIKNKSNQLFDKVRGYREHIHANPELSFEETNTMNFVSQQLTKLGIEHTTGVGGTGVVATIMGNHHTDQDDFVGLRSDLDALPIQEENDLPYASKVPGVMHACGHDVHSSILLGAAEIIQDIRNEIPSPVKLIFQPGEEKNPGGASLMIKDGVLNNPEVSRMYAIHVYPELEAGKVGFREGLYMASCDEIYITIKGKGGHGAMPHNCIDPIFIGSNIVTSLQEIVSRKCDPKIPCVLSFGHFEALGATNVIPSKAILKGTFRTMNETWRNEALALIESTASGIARSFGGEIEIEISRGYPFLENDPMITAELKSKSTEFLGNDNVIDLDIRMTAEDFSYYSQEVPVCFFRLGVRDEANGIIHGVHHPRFDIDSNALITGMQIMSLSVT